MVRFLLTALCMVTLGAGLRAQAPPRNPFDAPKAAQTMHLSVEASAAPAAAAPGGKVTLAFTITPRKDIHVYAPGKHDYQVVSFDLAPQPWFRAEATKYPPSEIWDFKPLNEKVEVYSTTFRLSREVTILDTAEAKKALAGRTAVTIAGTLQYQACDDAVCYKPAKVPVSFDLTIK